MTPKVDDKRVPSQFCRHDLPMVEVLEAAQLPGGCSEGHFLRTEPIEDHMNER